MKKFSLISLILIVGLQLSAQKFTLSGKISSENGDVLPGASVVLVNTFLGTTSNSNGQFVFKNLKPYAYHVEISFLGYETQLQKVELDKDVELNIQLKEKAILSEEVIVQASRANANTPVAQTNIGKQEIQKMNTGADVPFQLEMTPSVVATSENGTGNGYTGMRIRGTDMTRINVTVNGVPLNDSESQGVYWVNMPDFTSSVNSIQIQRGVGSSTNGAASFGASVNFQTLTLEPKPYAHISSSIGSFNTFKENIAVGTGLINNKFAFDVRASKLNSDGYIQRGFSDHQSLYFSGSYFGEKDMLKAVVMMGKERTGITWWGVPDFMLDSIRNYNPAGEYVDKDGNTKFYDGQTDNYWQNHYQLMYSREWSKHLNFNATLHATTGKGYYQQYKSGEDFADYGLPSDTIIGSSDLIRQKWLDNVFYGAVANLNYHKNNIAATLGIAGNNYEGDHFGRINWLQNNNGIPQNYEWYNNTGSKKDLSSFLKIQYNVTEQISAFADLQVRDITYKMDGLDDDLVMLNQNNHWTFVNPKLGLNYQMTNTQRIYASFAIANREPARADLKEALKGGGTQLPKPETLNDLELGYQLKQSNYFVSANLYYMLYDNQLVQTGELNTVGYAIMTNVNKSYRAGLELAWGLQILKNLQWNANMTYSQNKINDYVEYAEHYDDNWDLSYDAKNLGKTNISYSPELIASSQLRCLAFHKLGISLITKYVGSQYIDNTSNQNRKLDAYFLNNVGMDYSLKLKKGPEVRLNLLVNNILDVDYISNAYGGNWYEQGNEKSWVYYYPQAGINVTFKMAFLF